MASWWQSAVTLAALSAATCLPRKSNVPEKVLRDEQLEALDPKGTEDAGTIKIFSARSGDFSSDPLSHVELEEGAFGMQAGDVLLTLQGLELQKASADERRTVYARARGVARVTVKVRRGDQIVEYVYEAKP